MSITWETLHFYSINILIVQIHHKKYLFCYVIINSLYIGEDTILFVINKPENYTPFSIFDFDFR